MTVYVYNENLLNKYNENVRIFQEFSSLLILSEDYKRGYDLLLLSAVQPTQQCMGNYCNTITIG